MLVMVSILAGFFVGFLLLGTLVEWILDLTVGDCAFGCSGGRDLIFIAITGIAWAILARVVYVVWERFSPERAPSATEERIKHHKRGGR